MNGKSNPCYGGATSDVISNFPRYASDRESEGVNMEHDVIYFSRRAQEERTVAMQSANPKARRSHLDLAKRYDELVKGIESHHLVDVMVQVSR